MATRRLDLEPSQQEAGPQVRPGSEVINVFSVDVEEYFHDETFRQVVPQDQWEGLQQRVEPSTRLLLEMLDGSGVRGTFFVLGWVAERHPGLVREIHGAGHELAIHGYDHRPIFALSRDEFREDIRRAKGIVEDVSGVDVLGYRAPTFSVVEDTMWALEILVEEGIRYDSSVFPIVHDRYGIPDADRFPYTERMGDGELVEFPMSTVRIGGRNFPFVGGGYTRLFPMPMVRWGMRRHVYRERRPMMLYVHPWELDPGHPVLEATRFGKFRHYQGLGTTETKLRHLLGEFRFGTAREVLGI